jgi:hypothetical protein
VREAQLKLHQESAGPDEPYCAVALLGLPSRVANRDPQEPRSRLLALEDMTFDGKLQL